MRIEFNKDWEIKSEHYDWRKVTLPHDAMLEEARTSLAKGGSATGFFPGGKYTYRKNLLLTGKELKLHHTLEFGGVYKNAKVYINGREAGGCAYGYLPFLVSMDQFLKEGQNEIIVQADNQKQPDSRWYTGAGIYRPVYLVVQDQVRFIPGSIRVRTLTINPARIEVCSSHEGGQIEAEVVDRKTRKIVATGEGDCVQLEIPKAILWDAENPYLYDINLQIKVNGQMVETETIAYGIRSIERKQDGLYINGKKTLLKGGCLHHDNGILGAREFQESADRRISILKESGFNAIRSSHNPCSKEVLSACDRYGIYVIDETWDMWYRRKSEYDYAEDFPKYYREDIKALVRKDYNHPSVIMYSIGNEVSEPAEKKGLELAKEMVDLFHSEDDSRLVTGGLNLMIIARAAKGKQMYAEEGGLEASQNKDMSVVNSTVFNMIASMTGSGMNKSANGSRADAAVSPVLDLLDVAGYNYASGRYKEDLKKHPNRLILGSETFPQDIAANWKMVEMMPNLVGDFMWTAWDYLGEAGLGAWSYAADAKGFEKPYPWLLADAGVFDILGNPSGEALWTKTIWNKSSHPEISVRPCNQPQEKLIKAAWRGTNAIPSWSWRGCEGNKTIVEVYAAGDTAELYLNDKRIGKKRIKDYKAEFKVRYQQGVLEARVYDEGGNEVGKHSLASGQGEVMPVIVTKQKVVRPEEICYLDVMMLCENQVVDSNSDEIITIHVENGELLALGSANPRTEDVFGKGICHTWYGRAQAVARAGKEGVLRVTVQSNKINNVVELIIR